VSFFKNSIGLSVRAALSSAQGGEVIGSDSYCLARWSGGQCSRQEGGRAPAALIDRKSTRQVVDPSDERSCRRGVSRARPPAP
jgi:hypothetical protein